MKPYKVISSDAKHIVIRFTVGEAAIEKRFDIRYVPTATAEEFDKFCSDYIDAYSSGIEQEQAELYVDPAILSA